MMKPTDRDPDLDVVEEIYDALDAGEPERAHELATAALTAYDDDPVLHFLSGIALMEADRPARAVASLERATGLDPDDAEFRAYLALALYRCARMEEALPHARQAVEADAALPDAHSVLALLIERTGDHAAADEHLARAAKLDPDRFPLPSRMSEEEFGTHVANARSLLPEPFAGHLDEVTVLVEPLPADEILREEDPPLDPELFGLFVGVPLTGRSTFSPGGELPPRILVFQRNLERCFPDGEELEREIATTIYHELGHYLGLDEDELEAIDLA